MRVEVQFRFMGKTQGRYIISTTKEAENHSKRHSLYNKRYIDIITIIMLMLNVIKPGFVHYVNDTII